MINDNIFILGWSNPLIQVFWKDATTLYNKKIYIYSIYIFFLFAYKQGLNMFKLPAIHNFYKPKKNRSKPTAWGATKQPLQNICTLLVRHKLNERFQCKQHHWL